jgi:5-methylcytosine-specific restriction endonuclease McrA
MNNKIEESKIEEIQKYYLTHSLNETANFFNIGKTTVKKYAKKRVNLTDEEKKAKSVISVQKRREKIKIMSVDYKGGCCEKCGYDKYIGALEFHHLNPSEKDFTIAKGGHCSSWEKVKKELDKCILVCANCHREIHEEERNKNKGLS